MKQIFEILEDSEHFTDFKQNLEAYVKLHKIQIKYEDMHEYAVELWTDYTAGYL